MAPTISPSSRRISRRRTIRRLRQLQRSVRVEALHPPIYHVLQGEAVSEIFVVTIWLASDRAHTN